MTPCGTAYTSSTIGQAAVVSNGDGYLLGWLESQGPAGYQVNVGKIDSAGAMQQPAMVETSPASLFDPGVMLATDGTDYLVGWGAMASTAPLWELRLKRVSAAVQVLDGVPIILAGDNGPFLAAAVTSNGNGYLVTWSDLFAAPTYSVRAARLSAQGNVQDAPPLLITAEHGLAPTAVGLGTDYLVAWQDNTPGLAGSIRGATVTAEGNVDLTSVGELAAGAGHRGLPSLATNGATQLLVYEHNARATARLLRIGTVAEMCGDGVVNQAASEDCDEGGVESATCDSDCTFAVCGDGVVNQAASEDCDGSEVGGVVCGSDCQLVPAAETGCGCHSTGSSSAFGASIIVLAIALRRRRWR